MLLSKTKSEKKSLTNGGGYRPERGSPAHPHITWSQYKPYLRATQAHVKKLLRRKDFDTLLLRAEADKVFNMLTARPQHIRNGTPQERADAILGNVYAQQKTKKRWKQPSVLTPALYLVIRMMAMEICVIHSGYRPLGTLNRPRYRWVQLARTNYKHMLKADRRTYTMEGRDGFERTRTIFYRLSLSSWNVCRRMAERLEPVFKWYAADHGREIHSRVVKNADTRNPST